MVIRKFFVFTFGIYFVFVFYFCHHYFKRINHRKKKKKEENNRKKSPSRCFSLRRYSVTHYEVTRFTNNPESGFFGSFDAPCDPRDLGLICLVNKRKIHFRILSDLRLIQSGIFLKKLTFFASGLLGISPPKNLQQSEVTSPPIIY